MTAPEIYDRVPMNWVGDWAGRRALITPNAPALHDVATGARYTFADMNIRAQRVGAWLVDTLAVSPGDVV
ncbi:MAG: hypothetical protein AAFX99_00300, partial [Myxococcota bacterium]